MTPVIWSKSFPVKIISGIIKEKVIIPLLIKQNKWVRYKSFSLPPLLPPNHRQITYYRSRKSPTLSPTFVTDKSPTFTPTFYDNFFYHLYSLSG